MTAKTPQNARYHSLDLRVDVGAYRAEIDERPLALEPKAFDLLTLLLQHPGELLTKQEILDKVWSGAAVTDNALTRVVAQLRKALADDARAARYLETVPTRGYRWLAPVEYVAAPAHAVASATASDDVAVPRAIVVKSGHRKLVVRVVSAVGVVAAVAVVAMLWLSSAAPASPELVLRAQQVTTSAGLDIYPALSPDGLRVAYASDRSGTWEIYVRTLEAPSTEQPLTSDGSNNVQPAWSPDGQMLAFHSIDRGGVWVMTIGERPRQVSRFGARPAWAPDGRRIAFQSEPAPDVGPGARAANLPSTIWTVDIDGGQPQPLTRRGIPVGGHGAPAWSPDGTMVAFATADFSGTQVWAVDIAGGEPFMLSAGLGSASDPAYRADGKQLVFAGSGKIWRVALDARGRQRGAPESFSVAGLESVRHLSSAGGRVAIAGMTQRTQLWSAQLDAEGRLLGEPRPLTNDTRVRNSLPVFSPDGRRIAMMSSVRGQSADVWMMNADGSNLAPLTSLPSYEALPSWLPDATHVAYQSIRDGRAGLWRIDTETRREEQIFDLGPVAELAQRQGLAQDARLSPDGSRLAYSQLDPQTSTKALYVRSLLDGAAVRITSGEPPASYPAWSPDGRWIACELQVGDGSVTAAVVPATGGTPTVVTAAGGYSWVHGWSPDSTRILFAGQRRGVWNVYWVSREGGPEQRLTNETGVRQFVRYPSWSPRGDQIVFERGEVTGNIWVLDPW